LFFLLGGQNPGQGRAGAQTALVEGLRQPGRQRQHGGGVPGRVPLRQHAAIVFRRQLARQPRVTGGYQVARLEGVEQFVAGQRSLLGHDWPYDTLKTGR
jgi:hypothetical protein